MHTHIHTHSYTHTHTHIKTHTHIHIHKDTYTLNELSMTTHCTQYKLIHYQFREPKQFLQLCDECWHHVIRIYRQPGIITSSQVVIIHYQPTPLRTKETGEAMIPVCVKNTMASLNTYVAVLYTMRELIPYIAIIPYMAIIIISVI